MRHHWQKDYPTIPDLTEAELDENSSIKKMLHLIGGGKRVIDFGCATGYLARLLRARGCEVVGIEINERAAKIAEDYCEQVIVADLDYITLTELLPDQKFDVAVFGDVLEHLRNPWELLEEVRQILTSDGYVVASIPNVGHGAVRLALLKGQFQYEPLGLLDNTHLRFFTRETVIDLFEQSGYTIDKIDPTLMPVFSGLWVPKIERDIFPSELVEKIEQEQDADTFQFVLRAFPLTEEGKYLALESKYSQLLETQEMLQAQVKQLQQNYQSSQQDCQETHLKAQEFYQQSQQFYEQLQNTQQELTETHSYLNSREANFQQQLEQQKAQIESLNAQLETAHLQAAQLYNDLLESQRDLEVQRFRSERLSENLEKARARVQRIKAERDETQLSLENAQSEVAAMKTSKFWKLRSKWFGVKGKLGLRTD
ncbi:MAG: methyltransferase domain-containing protein [Elainella sp.]